MVPTPTKSKGKRIHDGSAAAFPQRNINNFQIVCSSDEEPMKEFGYDSQLKLKPAL